MPVKKELEKEDKIRAQVKDVQELAELASQTIPK